jgi:hypothetical protein
MTRAEISAIWTDKELKAMGRTRQEVVQSMLDEQAYEDAWANNVRFTFK